MNYDKTEMPAAYDKLVPSEAAESWNAYAEKLSYRADSILVQLADREFEEGLAALREHAKTAPPHEHIIEPVDFFVFQHGASSFT